VRNGRSHPVDGDNIDAFELSEVETFVIIGRGIVRFAAVVEVADIVKGDDISLDRGRGQDGDIPLPVALV